MNSSISLGKFGIFQANHLIGRPYHLTYEILDKPIKKGGSNLRIVLPSELYETTLGDNPISDGNANASDGVDFEVVNDNGKVVMRTNQHIVDDGISQKLTIDEIEALKKADVSGGKDVIAKILESHSALEKKTAFSLAKYTLRKTKKYIKRFTVMPVDVPLLISWLVEDKDAPRIMEMRLEVLSLVTSWSNAHWTNIQSDEDINKLQHYDHNRWLVVDEVSGLLVAALAERMGILYSGSTHPHTDSEQDVNGAPNERSNGTTEKDDQSILAQVLEPECQRKASKSAQEARIHTRDLAMSGTTNSITLVHQNVQPNLSLLSYFGYNVSNPNTNHPLYQNLKEISFLQLLRPEEDYASLEPPLATEEQLQEMKSRHKSNYYRKRRRWQRTKALIEETQAGGFAGLLVASFMTPASILHSLVPLLRGGAQVVVYSPTIEPLTELMDCYSKARKTAFTTLGTTSFPSREFPVDPTLLIGASLYTARSKPWQVLPGRTHPKMTGRGGSEGYVFVGTRVYPVEGKVEARGAYKRRRVDAVDSGIQTPQNKEPTQIIDEEIMAEGLAMELDQAPTIDQSWEQ